MKKKKEKERTGKIEEDREQRLKTSKEECHGCFPFIFHPHKLLVLNCVKIWEVLRKNSHSIISSSKLFIENYSRTQGTVLLLYVVFFSCLALGLLFNKFLLVYIHLQSVIFKYWLKLVFQCILFMAF